MNFLCLNFDFFHVFSIFEAHLAFPSDIFGINPDNFSVGMEQPTKRVGTEMEPPGRWNKRWKHEPVKEGWGELEPTNTTEGNTPTCAGTGTTGEITTPTPMNGTPLPVPTDQPQEPTCPSPNPTPPPPRKQPTIPDMWGAKKTQPQLVEGSITGAKVGGCVTIPSAREIDLSLPESEDYNLKTQPLLV